MSGCETLHPRWDGPIIVAAAGPSLTKEVAEVCRDYPTIAIKQAALRIPWASVVYACNDWQWRLWKGFPDFQGERWSCHHQRLDPKLHLVKEFGLRIVRGDGSRAMRFSTDPSVVHYGNCSGFAALGFAIHWLRRPGRIVMVGFDFRGDGRHRYFNGQHPLGERSSAQFKAFMPHFEVAARHLPEGVSIINATPGSALEECFPMMSLAEALA